MSRNLAIKPLIGKAANAVGISAWVLLGLFGFSSAAVFAIFQIIPTNAAHYLVNTTPGLLVLTAVQYVITLAVVVGIPLLIRHWSKRETVNLRELLGLTKLLHFKFVLLVPVIWMAYFVLSTLLVAVATLIPAFNADQAQDVGFANLTNPGELALAFIALVILAPLAEELLFRGYLFGKIRAMSGFWPSAIMTSLVFGFAHLQWNVGLDVFVLSLFLCYLREKSGSIWAGVLLHGFKNSVAYFILFIAPLIGINLQ